MSTTEMKATKAPWVRIFLGAFLFDRSSSPLVLTCSFWSLVSQWNSEMIWMLPTRAMPLEFSLIVDKGLFKDTLLSKVTLDLMTATDAQERVLTFGIYDGVPCELRLGLKIRTLEIPRPSVVLGVTLPRTRLILNETTFYPGANITGLVTMSLQAPLQLEELFIGVQGHSGAWIQKPRLADQSAIRANASLSYSTHLNRTATLAGITKKDYTTATPLTTLNPGLYTWMFEATLPMDLPPSNGTLFNPQNMIAYGAQGYTNYSVSLCSRRDSTTDALFASRKGFTNDFGGLEASILATEEIKILPSPFICPSQTLMATSKASPTAEFLSVTGNATMLSGGMYDLKLSMSNTTKSPVTALIIELVRTKTIQAVYPANPLGIVNRSPDGRDKAQIDNAIAQRWEIRTGLPLSPGAQLDIDHQLDVKAGLEPTVHSQFNPIIQTQYLLRVSARGNLPTTVELPIYMSLPMTDATVPAEPLGVPGELIVLPNPPQELVETALGSTTPYNGVGNNIPLYGATLPIDLAHNPNITKPSGITSIHDKEMPTSQWKPGQTLSSVPNELAHPELSHAFSVYPVGFRYTAP